MTQASVGKGNSADTGYMVWWTGIDNGSGLDSENIHCLEETLHFFARFSYFILMYSVVVWR